MHPEYTLASETRRRLLAGVAAECFDEFATWLWDRHYRPRTIERTIQSLAAWTDWITESGHAERDLVEQLAACVAAVRSRPQRKYQFGPNRETIGAARQYLRFLSDTGRGPIEAHNVAAEVPSLLLEFSAWLREHHGVTPATVTAYRPVVSEMIEELGKAPEAYTTGNIRDFALRRACRHGSATAKMTCTAVRAYLRFLGATQRIQPGMEKALPPVAAWSNPTVPRHLSTADLERLLSSVPHSGNGLRNRAILLILGRLGLRAGDVVNLRLVDIDFRAGSLAVTGKGRRRELLPLPQDVGNALLAYMRDERPRLAIPQLFLTFSPPPRPMSTQSLSGVVRRALDQANISAPTRGCHLLRHSAATSMLRSGATLAGVGAVLRHRRPGTTVKYAKADDLRLVAVAQPWPGVAPC